MEEFKDFEKYVKGVDPYGMQSGIVLIDPPEEWSVTLSSMLLPSAPGPAANNGIGNNSAKLSTTW